ncbi:MAG: rod shape-determining protein MreC [Bacteroidales bacterium]|nr:rod shape-determining protein MreC [Bacteroidales bacterium]
MPKNKRILSVIFSAAVFLVLEIAAFAMLNNSGRFQSLWFSRIGHKVMANVWGNSESIKDYFGLKEKNQELMVKNFQLSEELRAYKEKYGLPDVTASDDDFSYLLAGIIKISRNSQHNYIIIDKGYEDGVTPQSGLITDKGVVGIINSVESHYSFALSLMNTAVSVSARIGRDGGTGPLVWDGKRSNGATLKEIPLHFKFEVGDTVWTSGYSAIFPKDIPLGIIDGSKIINGAINECSVTLFEDFKSLKYVTVVTNTGRDEILSLENSDIIED